MKLLQFLGGLLTQRSNFARYFRITIGKGMHGIFAGENQPVVLVDIFFQQKGQWQDFNDRHGKYGRTFLSEHGDQLVLFFFGIGANNDPAF